MNDKEYIYVVLIKAVTGLGKFSRLISKYEYTHIAVSLDEKLDKFATFSRRKHYSPFDAGFMYEKREHYAFGNNQKVKVKIFKVPVSFDNKKIIQDYINKVEDDKEYIFNIYSMITMPILHGFRVYKAHNCMSFVGKIIELSCAVHMEKESYKYNIKEIDELLKDYFYKECFIKKYKNDREYMGKLSFIENTELMIKLNAKLIYRLLIKSHGGSYE